MSPNRMAAAWTLAARELGITFVAPFRFVTRDGRECVASGLLEHFGGPKGTLILGRDLPDHDVVMDEGEALGFYISGLSPSYEIYQREAFIETLDDWGWFGPPASRPAWFGGAVGRHGGRAPTR